MTVENHKNHSLTEVQDLISRLSREDIGRLKMHFRTLGCRVRAGLSEEDVFQEVAIKALEMVRAWPVGLSATNYFAETGRSIISNEESKYSRSSPLPDHDIEPFSGYGLEMSRSLLEEDSDHNATSNVDLFDKLIAQILEVFDGDEAASCYLRQKLLEEKKSMILSICKLTEEGYKNAVSRIKYTMRNMYPNGISWEEA